MRGVGQFAFQAGVPSLKSRLELVHWKSRSCSCKYFPSFPTTQTW
jgi:hypothetical protein